MTLVFLAFKVSPGELVTVNPDVAALEDWSTDVTSEIDNNLIPEPIEFLDPKTIEFLDNNVIPETLEFFNPDMVSEIDNNEIPQTMEFFDPDNDMFAGSEIDHNVFKESDSETVSVTPDIDMGALGELTSVVATVVDNVIPEDMLSDHINEVLIGAEVAPVIELGAELEIMTAADSLKDTVEEEQKIDEVVFK